MILRGILHRAYPTTKPTYGISHYDTFQGALSHPKKKAIYSATAEPICRNRISSAPAQPATDDEALLNAPFGRTLSLPSARSMEKTMKTMLAAAFLLLAHPAFAASTATSDKSVVSKSQEQAYDQTYKSDKAQEKQLRSGKTRPGNE